MTISHRTNGQIETWVLRDYFNGTLEKSLVFYASYWANRLNLTKYSTIIWKDYMNIWDATIEEVFSSNKEESKIDLIGDFNF